jgi:hypothetical protein
MARAAKNHIHSFMKKPIMAFLVGKKKKSFSSELDDCNLTNS